MQTWECALLLAICYPTHIRSASHTTLMSGTEILPAGFRFLEWYMNDKCLFSPPLKIQVMKLGCWSS